MCARCRKNGGQETEELRLALSAAIPIAKKHWEMKSKDVSQVESHSLVGEAKLKLSQ
jgi:hypothetical protein